MMSALGHSRPGPAGRRSSYVRYAPKATVGHQNAIGREGPIRDMKESRNCRASEFALRQAFRLIYLNETDRRPLFVFVELNKRLAA
jgi:hypothetical protein